MKRTYCHEVNDEELRQTIIRELYDKAYAIATSGTFRGGSDRVRPWLRPSRKAGKWMRA